MTDQTRAVLDAATPRPWSNVAAVPQEFVGDADLREMKADYALAELAVNTYEAREQLIDSLSEALVRIIAHDSGCVVGGTGGNPECCGYCYAVAALRLAREREK